MFRDSGEDLLHPPSSFLFSSPVSVRLVSVTKDFYLTPTIAVQKELESKHRKRGLESWPHR